MSDNKQNFSPELSDGGMIQTAEEKKHKGFSSKIGFVLAAAGSAVGLGNMWRFPYLAAQYGGGIFLICYIVLAILFGFTLLTMEIAIGRKTGKGVIGAFKALNKKFKWFGYFCIIVPAIIIPYYCVIGGWVTKYVVSYTVGSSQLVGEGANTALFFTDFISNSWQPLVFFLIFAVITMVVIAFGIQKGIENLSKVLMPTLAIIAIALMIYVLCQDGAGEGVKYFLLPDFSKFSFNTVLAALGQLFYSMSIGMCIMITYGSYMKKSAKIRSSSAQIAIFDSGFAIVAGLIIIPAIFSFSADPQTVLESQGPSLMFIQLADIFNTIPGGRIIAIIFFILVFFAALTSSISIAEAIVAVLCEDGRMKRVTACCIVFGIILVLGTLSALGYSALSGVRIFGLDILDTFDFLANNILIPIVAIITCVIAGYFIDKELLPKEIGIENKKFAKTYYNIIIRYVAPICILAILVTGLFLPKL